jgi:hypothetical protein
MKIDDSRKINEGSLSIRAKNLLWAKRRAWRWIQKAYEPTEGKTIWVDVQVLHWGECVEEVTVQVDPPEPKCTARRHAWLEQSVSGHGGGVIVVDRCEHCAVERVTDTYAQRPDNGVQGYRTVEFWADRVRGER